MLVKELIEILQAYPSDMSVIDSCGESITADDIHCLKDYPKGDGASPYCENYDYVLKID